MLTQFCLGTKKKRQTLARTIILMLSLFLSSSSVGISRAAPVASTFSVDTDLYQASCVGDGVYLYEHIDYNGACRKLTSDEPSFGPIDFGDVASSIKFVGSYSNGAYRALVCEHRDFGGICTPFTHNDANFGDNSIGNDRASSILIERTALASESIRIGTYNVQFLPWMPGETTNGCCEDINGRVGMLARRIIEGEYDIIALNEAFNADIQGHYDFDTGTWHGGLAAHLREFYPYHILHIDGEGNGCPFLDLCQDSGLMLFSRFPFEPFPTSIPDAFKPENLFAYQNGTPWQDVAFTEFGDHCSGDDCWANKGAAYVRIRNPYTGRRYNVVFTHLQADGDRANRALQLGSIESMLRTMMSPTQMATEDIFLLGDLNFDGASSLAPSKREEWASHFADGQFYTNVLSDTWEYEMHPGTDELPYEFRDAGTTHGFHSSPSILWAGGHDWGGEGDLITATDIAFGDIDGDGRDEIGVIRISSNNSPRAFFLNDALEGFALLGTYGESWGGADDYVTPTSIAFGDVDGDGRDEIGITRISCCRSPRVYVLDDARAGFALIKTYGEGWGGTNDWLTATSVAFGDIDGDGRDEIGITRASSNNSPRVYFLDDARAGFALMGTYGSSWGGKDDVVTATSVAFGDVDGDGRDEIGITRISCCRSPRVFFLDDARASFALMDTYGESWGGSSDTVTATDVAFGDLDGDGRDEIGITRRSSSNSPRVFFLDDARADFALMDTYGEGWGGSGDYVTATSVAFGDLDGDGRDEIGITRGSTDNSPRAFFLDDAQSHFTDLFNYGARWGGGGDFVLATAVAFGDVLLDGAKRQEFAITRRSSGNNRYFVLTEENFYNQLPHTNRYDYFLHSQLTSQSRQLCVQHATVGYNMRYGQPYREGSLGAIGNQDLSDHYALSADISRFAAYCNPNYAWSNPPLDSLLNGNITYAGNVQWLRVDQPGTYSIQIKSDHPALDFQVYKSTNLSAPLPRHSGMRVPFGWTYSVPEGPFYIKVFSKRRSWTGSYQIIIHQNQGDGADDAIVLSPNAPESITLSVNVDSAWFRLETEAPDSGVAQALRFFASRSGGDTRGLSVQLRAADGVTVIAQSPTGAPTIRRNTTADNNKTMFLVVQKATGATSAEIEAGWETNLTVLYGSPENPLNLQCRSQTEPDILGDDDEIRLSVHSDGNRIIDSVDLGHFDTGQVLGLSDVIDEPIRFLNNAKLRLVEDDDFLNPDDSLSLSISPLLPSRPGPDVRFGVIWEEDDTDGVYSLKFNLSHGSPVQAFPRATLLRTKHYCYLPFVFGR